MNSKRLFVELEIGDCKFKICNFHFPIFHCHWDFSGVLVVFAHWNLYLEIYLIKSK